MGKSQRNQLLEFSAVVQWQPAGRVRIPSGRRMGRRRAQESGVEVEVANLWATVEIEGWRLAYRAGLSGRKVVISEIRIYPAESRQSPGRWSGEELGVFAPMPAGAGITARLLRRIRVGAHAAAVRQFDPAAVAEIAQRGYALPTAKPAPKSPGRNGPGRPPLPPEYYERLAERYSDICRSGRGRDVNQTIARERGCSASMIKSAIARCRTRGLLE